MSAVATPRSSWLGGVALLLLAVLLLVPLAEVWRQSPDLRHGWAAVLLMAYLWWERWTERPAPVRREGRLPATWWVLALLSAVLALPLRLLLVPFSLWTTALWAYTSILLAVAAAAAWLRAGWPGVRWLLAPCLILASALPWPASIEQTVIFPLRETMAAAAAEVSNLFGRPALAVGTTVRLASGWVGIDEACGGIRSLQSCVMIALFFGEWFRFAWRRRLFLLASGTAAALVGNFSRVLFLSLVAGRGGQEAVHGWHDAAGWVALALSLAVTGSIACRWAGWRWPALAPAPANRVALPSPAAAWLAAVVALLALNEAATRAWFARGDRERSLIPQWSVAFPESHWSFMKDPLGEFAAELLRPDFYSAGHWQEGRDVEVASYYIEWHRGQVARFLPFAHNPTVCLPMAGCEMDESLGELSVPWNGLTIPFRAYRFINRGEPMWVAFTIWDPSRGQPLGAPDEDYSLGKALRQRWREVAERRADQPAQLLTLSLRNIKGDAKDALQLRLVNLLSAPKAP